MAGLKTGVENGLFLSEIGSGFGEPGGTPLPKIPRSAPPPPGMTKIVLLLLSNSAFAKTADEMNTQKRLDALLSGYGLQRVFMPKDGNCLFSSIAFSLQNMFNLQSNVIDSSLVAHLESIGITSDVSMERMIPILRKLTVDEFLGEH